MLFKYTGLYYTFSEKRELELHNFMQQHPATFNSE